MTVKELRQALINVPDDVPIAYHYQDTVSGPIAFAWNFDEGDDNFVLEMD